MKSQELQKLFDLDTIIKLMANIEEFERSYDMCLERILEDIKSRLKSCIGADLCLLNDITDYAAISEEKAYVLGVCEGIRIMKEKDQD